MSNVLARVATGVHEIPRGPDVVHRINVKRSWLERGEVIELTLPRNLSCAACSGGGCDLCDRSGAITLRSRSEPAQVLTVPLPRRTAEELAKEPAFVLRVPEQGGPAKPDSGLPRGLLLLRVTAAGKSDAGVRRARGEGLLSSLPPRPAAAHDALTPAVATEVRRSRWPLLLFCALVVIAVAIVLLVGHHR